MFAVIDPRMPHSAAAKLKNICEVVELPPFFALDSRVASHPDMLIFRLGDKLFVSKDYYGEAKETIDYIIKKASLGLVITDDTFGAEYPNDVKFNAFVIGNTLIGNTNSISTRLKAYAESVGTKLTNVKQGYAKCSTVVLGEAVISADKGICEEVKKIGFEALQISPDGVSLDGYGCGFIGGASGVFENKVFFCGDIAKHPDFKPISDFCRAHGYEVISLSEEPLYDVGTILFF